MSDTKTTTITFAVTILGNNSAIPAYGRNPTAQAVQLADEIFLIDCGEGTQTQLQKYKIKRSRINHIFISHLHGDHYFGLIGLITSMGLIGRTAALHIYSPPGLEAIIQLQLQAADTVLPYPLHFISITSNGILLAGKKITVTSFAVKHRIACYGFLFKEKKNPRKINAEKLQPYNIPASYYEQLQQGHDYTNKSGETISNALVTDAPAAPRSYAFCADTVFTPEIAKIVSGVDLLYHETTYLKDAGQKAEERFHSTTIQAAEIAKLAGAKKLIIGHFSSKYEFLDEFLTETQEVFTNTELALEGVCFSI